MKEFKIDHKKYKNKKCPYDYALDVILSFFSSGDVIDYSVRYYAMGRMDVIVLVDGTTQSITTASYCKFDEKTIEIILNRNEYFKERCMLDRGIRLLEYKASIPYNNILKKNNKTK